MPEWVEKAMKAIEEYDAKPYKYTREQIVNMIRFGYLEEWMTYAGLLQGTTEGHQAQGEIAGMKRILALLEEKE